MTLEELLKDWKEGDKIKIRDNDWSENTWFEPKFLAKNVYYGVDEAGDGLDITIENNYNWEIVKSTKKIKLFRYTTEDTTEGDKNIKQSIWMNESEEIWLKKFVGRTLIKTEEKEIEIDDEK